MTITIRNVINHIESPSPKDAHGEAFYALLADALITYIERDNITVSWERLHNYVMALPNDDERAYIDERLTYIVDSVLYGYGPTINLLPIYASLSGWVTEDGLRNRGTLRTDLTVLSTVSDVLTHIGLRFLRRYIALSAKQAGECA